MDSRTQNMKRIFKFQRNHVCGSALLLVLATLGLLMLAVQAVVVVVDAQGEESLYEARRFEAQRLAANATIAALHPDVKFDDPLLQLPLDAEGDLQVKIQTTGAVLDLNYLLADEKRSQVLVGLFINRGLEESAAEIMVARLADWVDADIEVRENGDESPSNSLPKGSLSPANRPFRSLDEVSHVAYFAEVEKIHPDWRNAFGLYGQTSLDINHADIELVAAVLNATLGEMEEFESNRTRMKNFSTTGKAFETLDSAKLALGSRGVLMDQNLIPLSVEDDNKWVTCRAEVEGVSVEISAVGEFTPERFRVLQWEER